MVKKLDDNKPRVELIPPEAIFNLIGVLEFGANKYAPNSWRINVDDLEHSRVYSSIQRHLLAYWDGEALDPESGLHHLDHAMTQIMFLRYYTRHGLGHDDRFSHDDH